MNKLLKEREKKFFEDRQKCIKESLIYHLNESLKENEYEFKTKNAKSLQYCEATSTLCFSLEAIFIHGLRDTFLQILSSLKTSSLGNDEDRPKPSFFDFIMVFLHKHDVKEIKSATQLSSDIGYSRAFIRKALNESLISSYFQNIRKASSSLKSYYHHYAFLCDTELVEAAENMLRATESYVVFDLPINSSLLNVWNDIPLQLSGLYSVPLKTIPSTIGEDIASSMSSNYIDIPQKVTVLSEIYTPSIPNSIFGQSPQSALDFDDRFPKILKMLESPDDDDSSGKECDERSKINSLMEEKMQESLDDIKNDMGNSISAMCSWSQPAQSNVEEENVEKENISYYRSASIDNHSFESLWNEKQRKSNVNFKEIWEKFEKTLKNVQNSIPEGADKENPDEEGFEIIKSLNEKETIDELQLMVETLCRLSTECGLSAQGFLCKGCKCPLIDISKAFVCGFDGCYYCHACISKDKYAIPSKIIYNFDFIHYTVSKRAAHFLCDYQFRPFIDFKILNPEIYSYIDEMKNLQKLRIQLNFLRAYIFTCSESTIAELRKLLYGKEYIYESIHLYSISDLYLIQNGALEEMLKRVVAFGREHCLKCALCSLKGFICEYCRRSKIIYPFDVEETMRCNICGTVSHINCYNSTIPCPKCDRKRKRQLLAALET